MSEDLIKRSDAIGAITNHCENECYYRVDNWCPQCQRKEFEEAIKAVPSADRPQEWIPCSERLPKEERSVLISLEWESVDIGWLRDGTWMGEWVNDYEDSVLAWMPLPKPYKQKEEL